MTAKKTPPKKKSEVPTALANVPSRETAPLYPSPFTDYNRLLQVMNRRFSEAFGIEPFAAFPTVDFQFPALSAGAWPALSDIADKGDRYEITSDIPGVKKEDINVSLHGGRVEISAETSSEHSEGGEESLYRERTRGSYFRAFELSDEVDADRAEAKLENGVLHLTLPKKHPTPSEKKRVVVK